MQPWRFRSHAWVQDYGSIANTTHYPTEIRDHFDLFWPSITRPDIPRVCTFVRRSLLKQLVHYTQHALSIDISEGEHNFFIHNIYKPPGIIENYGIRDLREAIQKADSVPGQNHHIVVGDFNIHDNLWSAAGFPHPANNSERAQDFKELIENMPLTVLTPRGVITRPSRAGIGGNSGTTLDLTLSSWELQEQLQLVQVAGISGLSDHLPIQSEFNTLLTTKGAIPRRNWKELDIDKLCSTLSPLLANLPPAQQNAEGIDAVVGQFVKAIQTAVDASTPWSKPTALSRPGFTQECRQLQKEAHRAQRQILRLQEAHNRLAPEPMLPAFRHKKAVARKRIKRYRNQAHQSKVTEAAESGSTRQIWNLSRWARDRSPYQAFTPPLYETDGTLRFLPGQKAALLTEAFFPPPPTASLADIEGYSYPEPVPVPLVTATEVQRAIHRPGAFKAAGPDDIPNRILQAAAPTDQHTIDPLSPVLANLFNSWLSIGYCPQHFREAKTVALRNPGKDVYSKPKSYRPIALLNTVGRVLEGVLALRLSYLAEEHILLPRNHFGGRKGQETDTALHAVVETIQDAWKRRKVATALLLDISGAFDSGSHQRLLHNLRKCHIPAIIVDWIASFLSERFTTLVLPEYTKPRARVQTGIPQGSPLSPILYLFYNADLIGDKQYTSNFGYIDDTTMIAVGNSEAENCHSLQKSFRECDTWAKTHASVLAPDKFALVHFRHQNHYQESQNHSSSTTEGSASPQGSLAAVDIGNGRIIKPSSLAKLLGVLLDSRLSSKDHLLQIDKKCSKGIQSVGALGRSKWGLSIEQKRLIYNACIAPKAMYASSGTHPRISGAFRTAYNAQLYLQPMAHRLRESHFKAVTHIATSKVHKTIRDRRSHHRKQVMQTALETAEEELLLRVNFDATEMEVRLPFAVPVWWEPPPVDIAASLDEAMMIHWPATVLTPRVPKLYTGGSGHHCETGASAYCEAPKAKRTAYLGTSHHHNVHAVEMVGLVLALRIANEDSRFHQNVEIYSDNQSALECMRNPRQSSGQYIIREAAGLLDRRREQRWQTRFAWIPAHADIPGHEHADQLAKQATGWREDERDCCGPKAPTLEGLPPQNLQSTADCSMRGMVRDWHREWASPQDGAPGAALRLIMPTLSKHSLQPFGELTVPERSALMQARTGYIGFNAALCHSLRARDDLACHHCGDDEWTSHVLFTCPEYHELRG
ncbi:hypothetical protein NUU61_005849 [Penicillium alfredii]|uniref:Reverse transcriptase n=1 Tax=Penicillium alfredii TaxID=1506179 RepID=A0A9W9K820_9EURO|nr:uncharacterized protein NUU61_005849 [Penicillium alfredii]KAJ5096493.1 hypothetical protein NUU61_005849 [Penicillium alfredii]